MSTLRIEQRVSRGWRISPRPRIEQRSRDYRRRHCPFCGKKARRFGAAWRVLHDLGEARSKAYDLVVNGMETAGGSIRIHRQVVQSKIFSLLSISPEESREKFEFVLDALRYGAPPHGGIAFGFDRWVMMLSNSQSLRDVVAFPNTQRAVCPLTNAPGPVSQKQLDELFLRIKPLPKK